MTNFKSPRMRCISSEKLWLQLMGAIAKYWWLLLLVLCLAAICVVTSLPCQCEASDCRTFWCKLKTVLVKKVTWIAFLTALSALVICICNVLSDINNLLRKENRITWSEIWKLIAIISWVIGTVIALGVQKDNTSEIAVGLVGSILAWIFQDRIKGAIAFIHLRTHHLLNLGDWILVPSLNADGEIKRVSLTTVTLENWDTTTSTIPIGALESQHVMNFQNMTEGRTYGRRMLQSFTLDTGWIRPVTDDEAKRLASGDNGIANHLPKTEIKAGALNAQLYRLYLYHWLMDNKHISQHPRLMVRWLEQNDSGMTLQVYAFITEGSSEPFEWQQSQIIEHILESMGWFGLKLYQKPSAYNLSNSNIHLTDKPVAYRMEDMQ